MKRFGLAVALMLASTSVHAQAISGSASGANSQVDVVTGAAAGVNITNNGQQPGENNRTYAQIETAPSLGGLALGGGHPCAYSPATAQFSIIGGGAGIGGMKIDEACMLMVMGAAGDQKAYNAAIYMIAARNPDACTAMVSAGLVSACVDSNGGILSGLRPQPSPRASTKSPATIQASFSKCEMDNGQIRVRPKFGADRELAVSQCRAYLGY